MTEYRKPIFSVIIPIFNSEDYLDQTLTSIMNQKFPDFEVLMVNDGSKDRSVDICKRFVKKDCRFKLFSQENQGVSVARNKGVEEAMGKYLVFVDSDDHVAPDYLECFHKSFCHTEADLAICGYYECYGETGKRIEKNYKTGLVSIKDYLFVMSKDPIDNYFSVLWNKSFKKELVDKYHIRFKKGISFGEDYDFLINYMNKINLIDIIPGFHYYYLFDRAGSLSNRHDRFYDRADAVSLVYKNYRSLWETRNLYRKNKKLVQFYGAKLFFEEQKERSKEEIDYLYQKILINNGFSKLDASFFIFLRKIKHLLKI